MFFLYQIVRVVKGRGDVFDTSGRIASVKGAALNMPPVGTSEGTVNLSQENEDLKVRLWGAGGGGGGGWVEFGFCKGKVKIEW